MLLFGIWKGTNMEEWRVVESYPHVEVSNLGNVRNQWRNQVIPRKPVTNDNGYSVVTIRTGVKRGAVRRIHNLVAEAFIGPKLPGMDVNHIDGDKTNNRVENLEYLTRSENLLHSWRIGTSTYTPFREKGERHRSAKVSDNDVLEILKAYAAGETRKSIAARYGISYYTVWDYTAGRGRAKVQP
jgi:hypothetical protein